MLKNFVFVSVFVVVISESQFPQGQKRFRNQEAGKLLRVANLPNLTSSKIFYYVPTNVNIAGKAAQNKQEVPALMTDSQFVENTMKLILETEKTKMESNEKLTDGGNSGIYYIYHPNGVLQKIEYETKNDDVETISTRVRYKMVEPIMGPIYTYDPETLVYRQI